VADLVDDFTVFNPCPGRRFMAMDSQQESSEPLHEIRRGGQTLTGSLDYLDGEFNSPPSPPTNYSC